MACGLGNQWLQIPMKRVCHATCKMESKIAKKYSPDILRSKNNDFGGTSWSKIETFSSFIPLYSEFLMTIGTRFMIQELSKSILQFG